MLQSLGVFIFQHVEGSVVTLRAMLVTLDVTHVFFYVKLQLDIC
jgi:hypothetical protein